MCDERRGLKLRFEWQCPHCGHINHMMREFTDPYGDDFLDYCDNEEGGCGSKVVVRTDIRVDARVFQIDFDKKLPTFRDQADLAKSRS